MSTALVAAYEKAESVSLHCTEGIRDAIYDVQLVPVETKSGIRWSVYAQNGRRGSKTTPRTKCESVSYSSAYAEYSAVIREKKDEKHYNVVPNARDSILDARIKAAKTAVSMSEPLPNWDGFSEFYTGVVDYLQTTGITGPQPATGVLVALTDLAFSSAEGVTDAIAQVRKCKNPSAIKSLLSADTLAWFQPGTEDRALAELQLFCATMPA